MRGTSSILHASLEALMSKMSPILWAGSVRPILRHNSFDVFALLGIHIKPLEVSLALGYVLSDPLHQK
jgi:hypothetical protein